MAGSTPLRWWQQLSQGIVRIFFIVTIAFLAVNLARSIQHNYQISRQIRVLSSSIERERSRIALLKNQLRYYATDTYREIEGRRHLGLVRPGESFVLIPENRSETAESATPVEAVKNEAKERWLEQPTYQQWWRLFFGPQDQLEAVFGS